MGKIVLEFRIDHIAMLAQGAPSAYVVGDPRAEAAAADGNRVAELEERGINIFNSGPQDADPALAYC